MIENQKIVQLRAFLDRHGELQSLSQIPVEGSSLSSCFILATMKSPEAATVVQSKTGLQLFGFNSLIISEAWMQIHLSTS